MESEDLDGLRVRTTVPILGDDGSILIPEGETFTWSDFEDHQQICGELVWIEPSEVEIIGDMD